MYADLAEASKVDWKDIEKVSAADKRKLTDLPVAMPRLRWLLIEKGVAPVENCRGASGFAGGGGAPPPAPSRAEEEEMERMGLEQEEERTRESEAKAEESESAATSTVVLFGLVGGSV